MPTTLGDSLNRRIKEQLMDKIGACASVAKVYGFERLPIEQYPAVFITYGALEGSFASTSENRRSYGYRTKILFPLGKDLNTVADDRLQYAQEAVAQVVEEIINSLDTDFELGQFNANVLYTNALDVIYTEYSYEGGHAQGAELTIVVNTDYDV